MWRRLSLAAALFCTTALTPAEAHAGPVVALVQAFAASVTAGATSVFAGLGFGATTAAALGGATSQFLFGIGLSAIANALTPRPRAPAPAEVQVNYAAPLSYFEHAYGTVRKGGPLGFTKAAASVRYYAPILACHSIEGVQAWYIDGYEVETDGSGNVITAPFAGTPHVGNLLAYTGQAGQAADPALVAAFPGQITSAHDFAGLSYVRAWCRRVRPENFSTIYKAGREWQVTAVIKGKDTIYDPRDASTGWSDNAALVIAENCIRHGKQVDWAEVAEQADICDALVTNAEGGTQRRWTINAVFSEEQTWEDVRSQLALAADVFFYERTDGQVGFKVGAWEAPTVTLTDRDFLSLHIGERQPGPDVVGEFTLRYVEPDQDWTEAVTGVWVEEEGGQRQETPCFLIDSHNQAARVAKRLAKVTRPRYSVSAQIKLKGYDLIGQRFFRIEHAEAGLSQDFEIGKLILNADRLSWTLEAVSTAEADFGFDAATEEPTRPERSEPTSTDDVPEPTGLVGLAVEDTGGVAAIEWRWDADDDHLRQQLRIRCVALGLDWQTFDAGQGETSLVTTGLVDGQTYEAELRNRTAANRVSDWSAGVSVQAQADTSAPLAVTGFGTSLSGSDVVVAWTASAAPYYAARIYRSANANFADAALVRTEYGAASSADSWTDVAPGSGTWRYWLIPISAGGQPGPLAGPEAETIP